MLGNLYEKTKTWGPGSCMVAFYFFSLIPIVATTAYGIYANGWNTLTSENNDLSLFLNALFFAPWFETLLLNVMLTKLFSKMKCRPTTTIVAVALIFAAAHTANGWIAPFSVNIIANKHTCQTPETRYDAPETCFSIPGTLLSTDENAHCAFSLSAEG